MKGRNMFIALAAAIGLICANNASAQNFSLKLGGGMGLSPKVVNTTGGNKIGPSITMEGAYLFNDYFSVALNLHANNTKYTQAGWKQDYGAGLRGLVKPFGKIVELGVGATGVYRNIKDKAHDTYLTQDLIWGMDFPIRIYAWESDMWQVMFYYDIKTIFDDKRMHLNYSNIGVMFGIRL